MTLRESPGDRERTTPVWSLYPGPVMRVGAEYAWRLIAIGVVVYFGVSLLSRLSEVVIPFIVSILVTALLHPVARRMRRLGMGRGITTVLTLLITVVVVGGLVAIVVIRAAQQAPQLGNEINNLLPHIKHWLIHGPLKLNPKSVNNLDNTISQDITKNSSAIASTALSTGKTVLSFVGGLLLVIFSTIFLVYDGDRVWAFLLKGVPVAARPTADAAGHAAWTTLSYYIRGTFVVAFFHGIVVAVTLSVLGVPLAFPLAVLVGLGSFVPLVGAVVTGVLAVAVAALSKGLLGGIVMTAVLLLDNQIEAHVLQPFVVGRYVRIHPLAVVLSLGAGALLFGIVGAIIAVPVVAIINSAVRAANELRAGGGDEADPPSPARAGGGDEVEPPARAGGGDEAEPPSPAPDSLAGSGAGGPAVVSPPLALSDPPSDGG